MKKILLGTSALIGAATLFSGVALADDPKVTIGGFSTFEAGWEHSDFTDGTTTAGTPYKNHEISFRNDNEIHFNVAGKTDQGLGYGAEIDLQADINGASDSATVQGYNGAGASNSGIVARRTYGWLQGDQWGHIEYGSNDSAARNLKVDASNIARATGGIDGDFIFFANANSSTLTSGGIQGTSGLLAGGNTGVNASRANFITAPRLPIEAGPADSFASDVWGNDTKITYYTPRFSGFQLGVSYTPELVDRGELADTAVATTGYGASNIWSGGLNYENQFDQIGVAAAVTGETGKSDDGGDTLANGNLNSINAWNAGAKLSFMGFSAAGSYGSWGDSLATTGTSADYWTGGLAYETGPFGASVTYLGSETNLLNEDNKFQDVSVGVDYKLAPGLTPFIEYTWFDIDPTGSQAIASENKGNVVIVGSQLSF